MVSGDKMVSDTYLHPFILNGAYREVKVRVGTKEEQIAIAFYDEVKDNGTGKTIVGLVDAFKLNEIQLAKADFIAYVKNFLKAVSDNLIARGKAALETNQIQLQRVDTSICFMFKFARLIQ